MEIMPILERVPSPIVFDHLAHVPHPDGVNHPLFAKVRALPERAPAEPLPEPGEGKIQYLMLVCTDPAVDAREFDRIELVDPWVADTDGRGIRLYGSELEPPGSARTVWTSIRLRWCRRAAA